MDPSARNSGDQFDDSSSIRSWEPGDEKVFTGPMEPEVKNLQSGFVRILRGVLVRSWRAEVVYDN